MIEHEEGDSSFSVLQKTFDCSYIRGLVRSLSHPRLPSSLPLSHVQICVIYEEVTPELPRLRDREQLVVRAPCTGLVADLISGVKEEAASRRMRTHAYRWSCQQRRWMYAGSTRARPLSRWGLGEEMRGCTACWGWGWYTVQGGGSARLLHALGHSVTVRGLLFLFFCDV